ncbi:NAD-dependent deacylase [bacterium]|nr:NAD-dependent deacylase [bacterium]
MERQLQTAAAILRNARRVTAFTGAGVSVESGIPPFRGAGGLWEKVDPIFLDLQYFIKNPLTSWQMINKIFYDFFGQAKPNAAHKVLARLEQSGRLAGVITQNIDHLHQRAGSRQVIAFHGTAQELACLSCGKKHALAAVSLKNLPPVCLVCEGILKPGFIFFGEAIPEPAQSDAFAEAEASDGFLVIGTTGEVMPACMLPRVAKEHGAKIIEVNTVPSLYTRDITDIFLEGTAAAVLPRLEALW